MSSAAADPNIQTYNSAAVIAHYTSLNYLTACERLLFETYIAEGSTILDLGVGGGRTTGILARRASRYVGADYAAGMVDACRGKFPALEFVVCDASDLSAFSDASFEVVVFAYNGIDFVQPDAARMKCFLHIKRVLKPGGVLILSSHNPRAVWIRSSWNRGRLRQITERIAPRSIHKLVLAILTALRAMVAFGQVAARSLVRLVTRIPRRTFWCGTGTLVDPAHGGLATHYSVPWRMIAEVELAGLRPICVVGDDYPARSGAYTTDWYYYVFAKARDL